MVREVTARVLNVISLFSFVQGGPNVGIQYSIHYILYKVYLILAHLVYVDNWNDIDNINMLI